MWNLEMGGLKKGDAFADATKAQLARRGIKLVIVKKSPEIAALQFARRACSIITDCGYQKIQRQWRDEVAGKTQCEFCQVESDVVVPVEQAAQKEQYTAGHFRPKITPLLEKYLVELKARPVKYKSLTMKFDSFDIDDTAKALAKLKINKSASPVPDYTGGTGQAKKWLSIFIEQKLAAFSLCRNNPAKNCLSNMSPYLHFGQISPLEIALEISKHSALGSGSYLEELIVRRELAINFVHYNKDYDYFSGLPGWAQKTLTDHKKDRRYVTFSAEQLELAMTGDAYWNASQLQMLLTGKMHGYMRMYWGKKLLEWFKDPRQAYEFTLYLNNKYEIDGREPNGYAGVAWCFGKHDRLWQNRPVFGKVRYMNALGLKRKFPMDDYVAQIERLKKERNWKPI
jgi:deoxyribodipyrimidine photo-lyase